MADQWAQATITAVAPNTATLAISAALQVGGNTTYTYTVSQGSVTLPVSGGFLCVIISAMQNSGNNGTFVATTFGTGTFTVANASGVTEAGSSGIGKCPSDSGVGLCVRGSSSALSSYFFHCGTNSFSGDGRTGYHEIWKLIAGAGTFKIGVGGPLAVPPTVGDVVAISAEGTTISGWINGKVFVDPSNSNVFSVTDASLSAGAQGITAWSINGVDEYNFAKWSSGLPNTTPGNNGSQANDFLAGTIDATTLESDSFAYGTNASLAVANPNWAYEGTSLFQVASNIVYASNGQNPSFAYRSDASPTADQFSEVTVVATGAFNSQNCGPAVRISSSAETAYLARYGNNGFKITKYVAGTPTDLLTIAAAPTTGQKVRLIARGTTLSVTVNGVYVGSVIDSSIASGNIGIFGAGNQTLNGFSAWTGGNYAWTQTESDTFSRANGPLGSSWLGPYPNSAEQTMPNPLGSINIVSDAYSSINSNGGDVYALFQATYSISGSVGVSGITVNYSGTESGSVTSTSGGAYTIPGLPNGSYTITPSSLSKTFSPVSQNETVSGANITGVNFKVISRSTRSK